MNKENVVINERYMLVTSLGQGGMADVYLGIDTILNREVAIKILRGELSTDPVTLLRFQREANAASKLHHPNVVEVYDVGDYEGKHFIVMEYIRGRTLKQLIQQRGAIHKEEAVDIMKQLVSAIDHAHSNNIIHRDIKPQNVLVKDDGTVKITDFGIALAHDMVQLTQSDAVLGSAHYLAPETTRGEPATNQIDIYALGIVFYELLSGSVPFRGENPVQIALKHLHEDIPDIKEFNPSISQSIANIILKATVKNKKLRYQTTKEMLDDLNVCLLAEHANDPVVVLEEDEEEGNTTIVMDHMNGYRNDHHEDDDDEEEVKEKSDADKKKMRIYIALGVSVFVILSFIIMYLAGFFNFMKPIEEVAIPNVTGKTQEEVIAELDTLGLSVDKIKEEMSSEYEEGIVISITPKSGSMLKKGEKVNLTVSKGKSIKIEDYSGKKYEDIVKLFAGTNIKIKPTYKEDHNAEVGTILDQSVDVGKELNPNEYFEIFLTVAKRPTFTMPNLIGKSVEEAKSILEGDPYRAKVKIEELSAVGFTPEQIAQIKVGVVVSTSPIENTFFTLEKDMEIVIRYYKEVPEIPKEPEDPTDGESDSDPVSNVNEPSTNH